ncbi:hypothetical protein QBC40DRAFT_341047 [Triangularia verruculosa]|uniref:Uncharacterized protein n=1 Tax=Triangularia verruculosa TaxID=2587418 RepID=A0AAN7AVA2_9PEZI|nr:hypothetical protein QBC40DRAFT_341047 [Triangularia verruculosa]
MLKDCNILGQTPFHLAVDNPECLSSLLIATKDRSLFSQANKFGHTPLAYVLAASGKMCRNGKMVHQCTECNCSESMKLLLEAGASLHLFRADSVLYCQPQYFLQDFLSEASESAKWVYASVLKQKRELLKASALQSLPQGQWDDLGLPSSSVLDAKVPAVIKALQTRGIEVPERGANFETGYYRDPGYYSLYMQLSDVHDADIFWGLGFRDTDVPSWRTGPSVEGKMLLKAHSMLYNLGASDRFQDEWVEFGNRNWLHDFLKTVSSAVFTDGCQCVCTLHGCTPFTMLLKGFAWLSVNFFFTGIFSPDTDAAPFFLRDSELAFDKTQYQEVLRFMTFEALQIPHTCCDPDNDTFCCQGPSLCPNLSFEWNDRCRWKPRCPEELSELESEHSLELVCFEKLLTGLETELDMGFEKSTNLGQDLLHFWRAVWKVRVNTALIQLEGDNQSPEEALEEWNCRRQELD